MVNLDQKDRTVSQEWEFGTETWELGGGMGEERRGRRGGEGGVSRSVG